MALTPRYANFDLTTGSNNGTSLADAWQTWAAVIAGHSNNQIIYFKRTRSRHDAGSTQSHTVAAGAAAPVVLEGYNATPGDGADSVNNYFRCSNQIELEQHYYLKHFDWAGSMSVSGDRPVLDTGTAENMFVIYGCKFEVIGGTTPPSMFYLDDEMKLLNSHLITYANQTAVYVSDAGTVAGCLIEMAGTGSGISTALSTLQYHYIINNRIVGSNSATGGRGISLDPWASTGFGKRNIVYGNSVVDCYDGIYLDGLPNVGQGGNILLMHNVVYDSHRYGIYNQGDGGLTGAVLAANAVGGSGTADVSGFGDLPHYGGITLTANPWNDAAGGDFRLNNTAGGGAAIKEAALTDPFRDGSTDNLQHLGAVQSILTGTTYQESWSEDVSLGG